MKTLIFDFDGTIADTLPQVIRCVNQLSEKYKYSKIKVTKEIRKKEMSVIVRECLKLSYLSLPRYVRDIKRLLNLDMEKILFFKNMKFVLEKLSKKYKIIILSSNSEENIKKILKDNKSSIPEIYSDSSIFGKRQVIKKLLKEKKLEKEKKANVIYVGDEVRDIDACKKAGIKIIAVTWGYNTKELLKKHRPDFLVNTPLELLSVLDLKK